MEHQHSDDYVIAARDRMRKKFRENGVLTVQADPLSNQLDLFDSRLNQLKEKKWNRDCLKSIHYGHPHSA